VRITDNRYDGEREKFELAMRLIGHEARTGTIRACTGFTEDRIRKLVTQYFARADGSRVRRRRGKTPRQIGRFVRNASHQAEATLLASLFVYNNATRLDERGCCRRPREVDRVEMGMRICQAFETYRDMHREPRLSIEWAWNLYHALMETGELYFAWCASCEGPYVQDRYALDYQRCPSCEMLQAAGLPDG
jgi:hypothetical protein